MDLDQRVKALEYELKILKNEIQRTLLEIQEQVLIHYYPTLRSDDSQPPADAVAMVAKMAAPPAPAAAVTTKKVSLDDIRAAQQPAASATPAGAPVVRPGGVDQAAMVKLLEWVNDGTAKLGGGRTGNLIEACVNKGVLDADTQAILQRLTSLSKDADPERVAANDVLTAVLKLDDILGRQANVDEALSLIEEAKLG